MESARYPVRWLLLTLAAILCIAFFPYIFEGKIFLPTDMFDTMTAPFNAHYGPPQAQNVYFYDGTVQTYPYKVETQNGLRTGHFAYWNPNILCGYPAYAETMGDNFDVFNILAYWLDPWHTMLWELLIEFFVAGIGMCLLLRYLGVGRSANLLFSAAYMLNSMFVVGAMPRWAVASFCWAPLIVLMILRYFRHGKYENLLLCAVLLALSFLGGNLQSAFFITVLVSGLVLLLPLGKRDWKKRVGIIGMVLIPAFAISAVMWIPSLELFLETLRHGSLNSSSVHANYSLPQRLLTLPLLIMFGFPSVLGSPEPFSLKRIAGVDVTDFNGGIAFLPVLFAVWGCFVYWKDKALKPFILIAAAAIVLPVFTPLFSVLYHRFFIVATFFFCIIGAVAFQSFLDHGSKSGPFSRIPRAIWLSVSITLISFVGLCTLSTMLRPAIATWFAGKLHAEIASSAFGIGNEGWMFGRIGKTLDYFSFGSVGLWLPLVLAAVCLFTIILYQRGKLSKQGAIVVATGATVLQLVLFLRLWFPLVDPTQFPIYPATAITSFLQTHASEGRYFVWRDMAKDPLILPSNSEDVYKINNFTGYESLTPRTMSSFEKSQIPPDSLDLRLIGLANVKYVVTRSHILSSKEARPVLSAEGLTVYENLQCRPRAYLASALTVLPTDSDVCRMLMSPTFDGSAAICTQEDALGLLAGSYANEGTIHITDVNNECVRMRVTSPAKGFCILTDTYYPGWRCYVNGIPRDIHRVNNAMRGVLVDAGESVIEFQFEPGSFVAGATLSCLALLVLGAMLVVRVLRSIVNRRRVAVTPA